MTEEVTIFNKINELSDFNYSGAQIASWSGLEKSLISRFLNGKSDISVGKFLQLIRSMPKPFQEAYWFELLGERGSFENRSWRSLINQASTADIEEILNAIADRWAELTKEKAFVTTR
jgi:transcriptional regulator with XRE-family HTH domain